MNPNHVLFAALPDLPGVRPLSWRRSDILTIELMQEHNVVVPITWDGWTGFNKCGCLVCDKFLFTSLTKDCFLEKPVRYNNIDYTNNPP